MWQKCPVCNGEGKIPNNGISSATFSICPTCNGQRIISSLTGTPPNSFPSIPSSETDFRDFNMESQQEYFGKK